MRALPPDLASQSPDEKALTGLSCVSCPGVLMVSREGETGHLLFRCRIGHVLGPLELIEAKECDVEEALQRVVQATEELSAFLREFAAYEEGPRKEYLDVGARSRALEAIARAARDLLETNEPIDLSSVLPGKAGGRRET